MTLGLFITIMWWLGTVVSILIVGALVYPLIMFLIACGMYVIPYFQSKIDLKSIASEKYENRIYITKAEYIIADDELQKEIDKKVKYRDEIQNDIRKLAANKSSLEAEEKRNSKDKK